MFYEGLQVRFDCGTQWWGLDLFMWTKKTVLVPPDSNIYDDSSIHECVQVSGNLLLYKLSKWFSSGANSSHFWICLDKHNACKDDGCI